MKTFYQYLWIFSSVHIFTFNYISCFSLPKSSSVYSVPNYIKGANICIATVFLWSFALGCTSNSHRLPAEIFSTKQVQGSRNPHIKYKSKRSKKYDGGTKTDRQGTDMEEDPNEIIIMEDLREHLISKLGVLDPMMCLPKALCGLSAASTSNPNSSSELVKDYLNHMKSVILSTTPAPPLITSEKTSTKTKTKTQGFKLNTDKEVENFDDEESESEEDEEEEDEEQKDEEEEEEDNTSEEEEDEGEDEEENDGKHGNELGDELDEDAPTESDEKLLRDYLTDKTEVETYLDEEDFEDVPSWWDNVPSGDDNTLPISLTSSLSSYLPSSMTSWFTSALPSFSWATDKAKSDIFEKDPFFASFRSGGRSLGNNNDKVDKDSPKDQQLSPDFEAKLKKRRKILNQYRKLKQKIKHRKGRKEKLEKPRPATMKQILKKVKQTSKKGNLTKVVLSKRIIQQDLLRGMTNELSEIENPMARLKTAVEIGKKLDHPRKCDILFSACPWKYDEVLEIIEDSHKHVKNVASSEFNKERVKVKKIKGGKGSALEKLKQTLKANSINSNSDTNDGKTPNTSIPAMDLAKETVVKQELPGGGHLEVKVRHPSANEVKEKMQFKTKKAKPSILKPFYETKDLGIKKEKKNNKKKSIEYKYPKYNYRVSFPNTDHKSIVIQQYNEITTKKPMKIRHTTTMKVPTKTKSTRPKKEKTKPAPESDSNEINVEDSGENIIIRIPKDRNPQSNTHNKNSFLFNPFRIYSHHPSPSYASFPTPTLIPATPQYYNQYYQYQPQQPQMQPNINPFYYFNGRNNRAYKRES